MTTLNQRNIILRRRSTNHLSQINKITVSKHQNNHPNLNNTVTSISIKCKKEADINLDVKQLVICNFTTWVQRDWCVPIMLEYFQKQTLKPDKIICWLSKSEYNGQLPQTIQKCVDNGWITQVKFVEGNTYGHKRYETFKENNDCINIMLDDDIYYPLDYVESLVNASFSHKNNVICYYTRQDDFYNTTRVIRPYTKDASFNNRLFSGLACFPPHTFPLESYEYSALRDTYCKVCDDSWLHAWLIKKGTKIYGLHTWGNKSPLKTIENSQDNGIWAQYNSKKTNGIIAECTHLANAIKIVGIEQIAKQIWPTYNFELASTIKNTILVGNKPYEEGISICVTAYNTSEYIEQALDSIALQTYYKQKQNYEILVGIDGCANTLETVKEIACKYNNIRVFYSQTNHGTYMMSNALISKAKYNYILRFDSDDIMKPKMIETVMSKRGDYDMVRYRIQNFGGNSTVGLSYGSTLMKHTFFDKIGGYQPWICSADSELFERISKFANMLNLDDILYKRRVHSTSLTQSEYTSNKPGKISPLRKKYYDYINSHTYNTIDEAYIYRVCTECQEIQIE